MRRAGELVTLTPWWSGDGPEPGDVLESSTGRAWRVETIERSRRGRVRYVCRVLDDAESYGDRAVRFAWSWAPRGRS